MGRRVVGSMNFICGNLFHQFGYKFFHGIGYGGDSKLRIYDKIKSVALISGSTDSLRQSCRSVGDKEIYFYAKREYEKVFSNIAIASILKSIKVHYSRAYT